MGLEPTTPCVQIGPRRTSADVCEYVRPDQGVIGTSANAWELDVGWRMKWCISPSVRKMPQRGPVRWDSRGGAGSFLLSP
jgi:hypothetical protein